MRITKFKVCVTGGRDYSDKERVTEVLDKLLNRIPPWIDFELIHGDAKGADTLSKKWAESRKGVIITPFPVLKEEWTKFGLAAGPMRNKKMLNYGFHILVAFPGNNGTENMKKITSDRNIKIWDIK